MQYEVMIWSIIINILVAIKAINARKTSRLIQILAVQSNIYPEAFDNVLNGATNLLEYNYSSKPVYDDDADLIVEFLTGD